MPQLHQPFAFIPDFLTIDMSTVVRKKLKSREGASLMAALLVFLVCAMVGSVVLTAAATSAGRASKADTPANRQRYSLESAARLINDDLTAVDTTSTTASNSSEDIRLHESWSYRTVAANFVTVTPPEQANVDGSTCYLYQDGQYEQNVPAQVSAGDFVLKIDQNSATSGYQTDSTPTELKDDGGAPDNKWSDDWNWTETAKATKDTQYSGYVTISNDGKATLTANADLKSFKNLRDIMAEAIFRHYWYSINNTTETGLNDLAPQEGKSVPASSDPWGGNLSKTWANVVKDSSYQISTQQNSPLTITLQDESGKASMLDAVYADVSMDQDFVLTFHLYCKDDSSTSSGTTTDASIKDLYLTYRPAGNQPALTYSSTSSVTSSGSPYGEKIKIYVKQGQEETIARQNEDALRKMYSSYYLRNIKWGNKAAGTTDQYNVTFDYYAPVDVTRTITTVNRSVDLQVTWDAAEVTSIQTATDSSGTNTSGN